MINILLTILFSSFKFALTFPVAVIQFNFNFWETILWTNVGGLIGIYFFAFLSRHIVNWWKSLFRKNKGSGSPARREKPWFTKKNRRIVRIKQKYGLPGIAFFTPLLLSIPVGAFLVIRYYRHSRVKITYLLVSNVFWSMIYAALYIFGDSLLLRQE